MADHGSMGPRAAATSHVVLGRGGFGIRLVSLIGLALFAGGVVVIACQAHPPSLSETLQDCALFGFCIAFYICMLVIRIEADDDNLVLVDLFTVALIPAEDLSEVRRDNGLQVVTFCGARYGHIGYGRSVIANLTGNRRARRVAAKIGLWLAEHQTEHSAATSGKHATRRVRWAFLLRVVSACVIGAVAIGLVLHSR